MRTLPIAPGSLPATGAAVLALAVDVLYLAVIRGEGEPVGSRVGFVAASLAAAAVAVLGAALLPPTVRLGFLGWAAATLGAWAFLGGFSIGLLLVPSLVLTVVAADRAAAGAPRAGRAALTGVAAAVAVVVLGLYVTA